MSTSLDANHVTVTSQEDHGNRDHAPLDDLRAALEKWTARPGDGRPYLEVGDGLLHHTDYPPTITGAAALTAIPRAPAERDLGAQQDRDRTPQNTGRAPASTGRPAPRGGRDGGHT